MFYGLGALQKKFPQAVKAGAVPLALTGTGLALAAGAGVGYKVYKKIRGDRK